MNETPPATTFLAPEVGNLAPLFPGYNIHQLIATGGMGAVYSATQLSLERMVAIKILPEELSQDQGFSSGFTAEARVMARLSHPNLIAVYDFGAVGEMLFIVMEYVPGKSIFHSANGLAIDPDEVIRLVCAICHGLAHAHENGILHRDIKPSNVLLTPQKVPKIGDFGLARPVERKSQAGEVIFGTPGYTAPEVVNAPETVDQRADLFSVGILLHELLTGKLPTDDPRPASSIVACDRRFDKIIRRATDPNPANRYSSAGEIANDLQAIVDSPNTAPLAVVAAPRRLVTTPSTIRPAVTPLKKKSRLIPVLICAGLVAFAAFRLIMIPPPEEALSPTSAKSTPSPLTSQQPPSNTATHDSAKAAVDEKTAQQEIFRQFQGVYWDGDTWYLFAVDPKGKVRGFQVKSDSFSPIEGTIKNREFASKWTQSVTQSEHDFTYRLLPNLNIQLDGTCQLRSGKILHHNQEGKRVTDANECLQIMDRAASLATTEEVKSVISQLQATYVDPFESTDSNSIHSTHTTDSKTVLEATNMPSLRERFGKHVTVRGRVVKTRRTATGKTLVFEFSESDTDSLSVLMPVSDAPDQFTGQKHNEYVGKSIQFSGFVGAHPQGKGAYIKIESFAELKIIEDGRFTDMKSIGAGVAAENRVNPSRVPSDATYFNGKWYRVYADVLSWNIAGEKCRALGGQLVVIPNRETQDFVKKLLNGEESWLGATDRVQEGIWLWSDGSRMMYDNFASKLPDNLGGHQHYLHIWSDGKWDDVKNEGVGRNIARYICEWPDKPLDPAAAGIPGDNRDSTLRLQLDQKLRINARARLLAFDELAFLRNERERITIKSSGRAFPVYSAFWEESDVFVIHPHNNRNAGEVNFSGITEGSSGTIRLKLRDHPGGDCRFQVIKSGVIFKAEALNADRWQTIEIPFKNEPVTLLIHPTGWMNEFAFVTYDLKPTTSDIPISTPQFR